MATPRLGLVVEDKPTELSCILCTRTWAYYMYVLGYHTTIDPCWDYTSKILSNCLFWLKIKGWYNTCMNIALTTSKGIRMVESNHSIK